jgi:heme-degrading monooxygenase HmoA
MITRIVKLSFIDAYYLKFEEKFPAIQQIVLSSKGCNKVHLLKSDQPGIYFTYSIWDDEILLNQYRNSSTFKEIWKEFKLHFKDDAQAWTTVNISPKI